MDAVAAAVESREPSHHVDRTCCTARTRRVQKSATFGMLLLVVVVVVVDDVDVRDESVLVDAVHGKTICHAPPSHYWLVSFCWFPTQNKETLSMVLFRFLLFAHHQVVGNEQKEP